jgi:hypothetical protein
LLVLITSTRRAATRHAAPDVSLLPAPTQPAAELCKRHYQSAA